MWIGKDELKRIIRREDGILKKTLLGLPNFPCSRLLERSRTIELLERLKLSARLLCQRRHRNRSA